MTGKAKKKRSQSGKRDGDARSLPTEERANRSSPLLGLVVAGFLVGVIGVVVVTRLVPTGQSDPGKSADVIESRSGAHKAASARAKPASATSGDPERAEIRRLKADATRVADELVVFFPSDPQAMAVSAQLAFRLGDSTGAIESWEKCLDLDPGYLDAYYKMALIAAERGQYRQAEELYRKLLAKGPPSSHVLTGLAETLLHLGRTDEAIDILNEEQRLQPGPPTGLVLLGQTHLQLGNHEKAKECFKAAVESAHEFGQAHHGLAMVCERLGQTEYARQHRERFQALKTSDRSAYPDPGGVLRDLESIRRCVALVHMGAAEVHQQYGNLVETEQHYRGAAAADDTDTTSRSALAAICQQKGRTEEALVWAAELREIEPDNPQWPLLTGSYHILAAQYDAAEKAFRQACELASDRAAGYVGLAHVYVRSGRGHSRAMEFARKAVQLEPIAPAYHALSVALHAAGDFPGARMAIQRAIHLDPQNTEYRRFHAKLATEH
jgi:tetratricopeptide (TPR) repeat protein